MQITQKKTKKFKDKRSRESRQTQSAHSKHQENSINDWKRDFAIAIKLAFQLAQQTTPLTKSFFIESWNSALQANNIEKKKRQEARELFWKTVRQVMPTQKARRRKAQ